MNNILNTEQEILNLKYNEYLKIQCPSCSEVFPKLKKEYTRCVKNNPNHMFYCSSRCTGKSQSRSKTVPCLECETTFTKTAAEIKKTKKHFCSRKCHMTYCNKNKLTGVTRSRVELKLEERLSKDLPELEVIYSDRSLGLELDIFIPTKQLAFEIQGIFHYEPIFGEEKLAYIQANDERKRTLCKNAEINLIEIDISKYKYITEDRFEKIYSQILSELQ